MGRETSLSTSRHSPSSRQSVSPSRDPATATTEGRRSPLSPSRQKIESTEQEQTTSQKRAHGELADVELGEILPQGTAKRPRRMTDIDGEEGEVSNQSVSGGSDEKKRRASGAGEQTRKRSQRMFGMLLGTLNKFKQETSQKSEAEKRREELEAKLQEKLRREKEELTAKIKQDRSFEQEIARQLREERNAHRIQAANEHKENQLRYMSNFIKTITKPSLCWLPKKHNEKSLALLTETKRKFALESAAWKRDKEQQGRTDSKLSEEVKKDNRVDTKIDDDDDVMEDKKDEADDQPMDEEFIDDLGFTIEDIDRH